jgi:hypothetical protein
MIPRSAVVVLSLVLAFPVLAEPIRLRSGEHADFSRIVVDAIAGSRWQLGRTAEGYELRLKPDDAEFDFSNVYRMIPRTRLASLGLGSVPGSIALRLACDCHAVAFQTANGAVVVDVRDGPAAGTESPFEQPFSVAAQQTDERAAVAAAPASKTWWSPASAMPGQATGDHPLATMMTWANSHDGVQDNPVATASVDGQHADPSDASQGAGSMPDTGFREPDQRIRQAEEALLRQIGRAATQGLIRPSEMHVKDAPKTAQHSPEVELADVADAQEPATQADPEAEMPMIAETVIDRDVVPVRARPPVTAEGESCVPATPLDIESWGDVRAPTVQIADRRGKLVGEFDRPNDGEYGALARLYIYLGFGAEARAILASPEGTEAGSALLDDIANIVDGTPVDPASDLSNFTDCDSELALWSLLALRDPNHGTAVDRRAILRSFAQLPPMLRQALGPDVAERFIAIGQPDAGEAIRNTLTRRASDDAPEIRLMEARLDIAQGAADLAQPKLEALTDEPGPVATDSLLLTIESRLDRNLPVERKLVETAAALAFERKGDEIGQRLRRAHVLGLASAGAVGEALQEYAIWEADRAIAPPADVAPALLAALARLPDDAEFADLYFGHDVAVLQASADSATRLALAGRLLQAGLSAEVPKVVPDAGKSTETGKILLAEAAIAEFDPVRALDTLAGQSGDTAAGLRVQALELLGDHAAAAREDAPNAGDAAWRAREWSVAAETASEARRDALIAAGLVAPDEPTDPPAENTPEGGAPQGELGAGRLLLEESRSARAAFARLLSDPAKAAN